MAGIDECALSLRQPWATSRTTPPCIAAAAQLYTFSHRAFGTVEIVAWSRDAARSCLLATRSAFLTAHLRRSDYMGVFNAVSLRRSRATMICRPPPRFWMIGPSTIFIILLRIAVTLANMARSAMPCLPHRGHGMVTGSARSAAIQMISKHRRKQVVVGASVSLSRRARARFPLSASLAPSPPAAPPPMSAPSLPPADGPADGVAVAPPQSEAGAAEPDGTESPGSACSAAADQARSIRIVRCCAFLARAQRPRPGPLNTCSVSVWLSVVMEASATS